MTPSSEGISRRGFLRTAGIGMAGLTALGAAGCRGLGGGSSSGEKTLTLTWWSEGKRAKRTQDVADLYTKKNEGVKIQGQFSGFDGYFDKLATRVAGGNPPDVFQLHIESLLEYAERGTTRSLEDLAPDPLKLDDSLPSYVLDSCRYEGKLHFVPLGLATAPSLVYSRTKLDRYGVAPPKPDWALDDFVAFAEAVTKASKGKVYGTSEMGGSAPALEAYLRSQDEELFTTDGKLGFAKEKLNEWLSMWDDLRKSKACVPAKVSAAAVGFDKNPITTGQAVITVAASSKGVEGYQNLVDDELEAVPFPRYRKGGPPGTMLTPIEWWALSSKMSDEKAKLAADFAAFAISERKAVEIWAVDHGVPVYTELRTKTAAAARGTAKAIYDDFATVEATKPAPRRLHPAGAGELLEITLSQVNQDVGFRKLTVAGAVDKFFREADRVLK